MIYNFKNDTLFFNRYLRLFRIFLSQIRRFLLKTSCHCERVQRAKQSFRLSQSLLSNRQTAWIEQIASLVALVRNDSRCLADCTALFILKNRKPLLTRYLAMTAVCLKISENHFHFSII